MDITKHDRFMNNRSITFDDLLPKLKVSLNLQHRNILKNRFCSIPFIQGGPGVGKTEYMKSMIKENKFSLNKEKSILFINLENTENIPYEIISMIPRYLACFALENMSGLPMPLTQQEIDETSNNPKLIKWSLPDIFDLSKAKEYLKEGKTLDDILIVIFLDDIHLIQSNMSPYLFQLFSYRTIHNYKLPDNVLIACAGNGPEDNSGYQQIPAAIVNRYIFYYIKSCPEVWTKRYAIKNDVRPEIISFINHDPQWFSTIPVNDNPFCSPRSWTAFSDHLWAHEEINGININDTTIDLYGYGLLDYEAVTNFRHYMDLIYSWEADGILSGKRKLDFSTLDKIDCYALMTSCCGRIMKLIRNKEDNPEYINKMREIIKNMSERHQTIIPLGLSLIFKYETELDSSLKISKQLLDVATGIKIYDIT